MAMYLTHHPWITNKGSLHAVLLMRKVGASLGKFVDQKNEGESNLGSTPVGYFVRTPRFGK
jgi:hypothetical protein